MKLINFLWGLACLGGNVYQLYSIGSRYFQYDVSTNVQVYTPELIDMPTIILCMNAHKLLKWDNMTLDERKILLISDGWAKGKKGKFIFQKKLKKCGNRCALENATRSSLTQRAKLINWDTKRLIHNIRKNLKSNDLFRLTDDWYDQYRDYHVFDPNTRKQVTLFKNLTFLKIKEFIVKTGYMDKCTLLEVEGRFKKINYLSVRTSVDAMLFQIEFDYPKFMVHHSTVEYHLSPSGLDLINHASSRHIKVTLDYASRILTYDEYRSNLLPPPFTTKCRNYSNEGLRTMEGCFHDCMKTLCEELLGDHYPFEWIFPDVHLNLSESKILSSDNVTTLEMQCSKKCRQFDCSTVLYVPRIIGRTKIKGGRSIIQVPSQTPVIQSNCEQKVTITQFFTEAASTIAFWFGISIMTITGTIGEAIQNLYRRINNQRVIRPSSHFEMRNQDKGMKDIKKSMHLMLCSIQRDFDSNNRSRCQQRFLNLMMMNNYRQLRKQFNEMSRINR